MYNIVSLDKNGANTVLIPAININNLKFFSSSIYLMSSQYGWNILNWDVKQKMINQSVDQMVDHIYNSIIS